MGKVLCEFSQENAGLEALHFHGEPKHLKIGLPLAFSELPKQKIKRLIRFIVDFNCVQNVPKDLLGQTGQSIGEPEFLCFGARCGELDGWFLLIVGAKLDLRGGCCRDGLIIV
jgi:hypothetical protein